MRIAEVEWPHLGRIDHIRLGDERRNVSGASRHQGFITYIRPNMNVSTKIEQPQML